MLKMASTMTCHTDIEMIMPSFLYKIFTYVYIQYKYVFQENTYKGLTFFFVLKL